MEGVFFYLDLALDSLFPHEYLSIMRYLGSLYLDVFDYIVNSFRDKTRFSLESNVLPLIPVLESLQNLMTILFSWGYISSYNFMNAISQDSKTRYSEEAILQGTVVFYSQFYRHLLESLFNLLDLDNFFQTNPSFYRRLRHKDSLNSFYSHLSYLTGLSYLDFSFFRENGPFFLPLNSEFFVTSLEKIPQHLENFAQTYSTLLGEESLETCRRVQTQYLAFLRSYSKFIEPLLRSKISDFNPRRKTFIRLLEVLSNHRLYPYIIATNEFLHHSGYINWDGEHSQIAFNHFRRLKRIYLTFAFISSLYSFLSTN